MANIIIQENGQVRYRPAVHGEEITIQTPCNCSEVTGVKINNVEFPFYDAAGNNLMSATGLFAKNSLIRVMIDTVNKRAYILNRAVPRMEIYEWTETLSASSWDSSSGLPKQKIMSWGITSDTHGIVRVNYQGTTLEQREAARKALLCLTDQGENFIEITADGELPTVDIPIVIRLDFESV